jgi:hypothetical protein
VDRNGCKMILVPLGKGSLQLAKKALCNSNRAQKGQVRKSGSIKGWHKGWHKGGKECKIGVDYDTVTLCVGCMTSNLNATRYLVHHQLRDQNTRI